MGLIAIAGILLSLILYGLAAWGDSVGQAQREGKEPTATTATLPSNRKYVASANYGDDWPLSVGEGYVYSMELEPVGSMRRFAAIFEAGGIRYGMNGTALTAGYADINTIRTGEKIVGIVPEDTVYRYKDVGFLIEMALENKN
ncbi:MAG TPA: hypothetical protein VN673_01700 [Clostridia bacterium]|nr:hypothetical protein [Clostridia bacterium]